MSFSRRGEEYEGRKAYVQQLRDPVSHLLYDADGRALFAAFLMMDVSGEFFYVTRTKENSYQLRELLDALGEVAGNLEPSGVRWWFPNLWH